MVSQSQIHYDSNQLEKSLLHFPSKDGSTFLEALMGLSAPSCDNPMQYLEEMCA